MKLLAAHLEGLQAWLISTHTGQLVHTVALEVEPASIEGGVVGVSVCAAGLEAHGDAALDPVYNAAFLSLPTARLLTLHLLRACVTHTPLLTQRVGPESLTWQVIAVVVVTATALLLDHTPEREEEREDIIHLPVPLTHHLWQHKHAHHHRHRHLRLNCLSWILLLISGNRYSSILIPCGYPFNSTNNLQRETVMDAWIIYNNECKEDSIRKALLL